MYRPCRLSSLDSTALPRHNRSFFLDLEFLHGGMLYGPAWEDGRPAWVLDRITVCLRLVSVHPYSYFPFFTTAQYRSLPGASHRAGIAAYTSTLFFDAQNCLLHSVSPPGTLRAARLTGLYCVRVRNGTTAT